MTTATGVFTLPRLKDTKDTSQQVFLGSPTWARLHLGAGQYRRIRLERLGDTYDADSRRFEVWSVPAADWSPRDRIEIGPVPDHVLLRFEVADQYAMAAAFLPSTRSWSTTRPLHNPNT